MPGTQTQRRYVHGGYIYEIVGKDGRVKTYIDCQKVNELFYKGESWLAGLHDECLRRNFKDIPLLTEE